jgi:hypothetical protein
MRTFDLPSAERVPVKVGIRASRPSCIAGIALLASALCSPWLVFAAGAQASPAPIPWSCALDQPAGWYASAEAVRIAENVLQYQHDNGGWEKNIDMARPLADSERTHVGKTDLEGGTTIDNGATWTQIRYLARVYEATRQPRFRDAMLRGVDFLLAAQYANGGWPQFYPIRRGYYEHVTFNDGAMIGANKPMFVGRDGVVRSSLAEIEQERRVGYNYLGGWARELLASEYPAWRQRVGPGVPSL